MNKKENLQARLLEVQKNIANCHAAIERIRASDDYLASKERRELDVDIVLEMMKDSEKELSAELQKLESNPDTSDTPPCPPGPDRGPLLPKKRGPRAPGLSAGPHGS